MTNMSSGDQAGREAGTETSEQAIRRRELDLREMEVRQTRRNLLLTGIVATAGLILTTAIGALSIYSSSQASQASISASADQFKVNSRMTYFQSIINGLGSSSAAVQATSMRLLAEYVGQIDNYDGHPDLQQNGAQDAIRTLVAFVRDRSGNAGAGLTDYRRSLPIIVESAMSELKGLDDGHLGVRGVELSGADLHGMSMQNFHPGGEFRADAADLRRADLTGMDLTAWNPSKAGDAKNSMASAFLTCATLKNVKFGSTNLAYADLSGADLSGADLSGVGGLTRAQLTGARTNDETKLPEGVPAPPRSKAWMDQPGLCANLVLDMTGMRGNQGYTPVVPCPTSQKGWPSDSPQLADFTGRPADVVKVCAARQSG